MSNPTDADVHPVVQRAVVQLVMSQPWFAALALRLRIEADPKMPTAATDGVRLLYNPAWVSKLPKAHAEGVIAHEVMHCAFLHFDKATRGGRDPRVWNMAGDHVINLELLASGFKLPGDCLADPRFKGMSTVQVYNVLQAEQEASEGGCVTVYVDPLGGVMDAPQDGAGGPQDGPDGPGAAGGDRDTPLADQWTVAVAQATMVSDKAGKTPAGMRRAIGAERERAADWRATLQRFLSVAGDVAWSRPNRRFVSRGLYLPGPVVDRTGDVVIAVDTSGSVDERLLSAFAAEACAILDAAGWPTVHVIYCDTETGGYHEWFRGDAVFAPVGGGGTAFQPVFDWVEREGIMPTVLFYLTDLYAGDAPRDPGYPVVWVAPSYSHAQDAPWFGETVRVPLDRE